MYAHNVKHGICRTHQMNFKNSLVVGRKISMDHYLHMEMRKPIITMCVVKSLLLVVWHYFQPIGLNLLFVFAIM